MIKLKDEIKKAIAVGIELAKNPDLDSWDTKMRKEAAKKAAEKAASHGPNPHAKEVDEVIEGLHYLKAQFGLNVDIVKVRRIDNCSTKIMTSIALEHTVFGDPLFVEVFDDGSMYNNLNEGSFIRVGKDVPGTLSLIACFLESKKLHESVLTHEPTSLHRSRKAPKAGI